MAGDGSTADILLRLIPMACGAGLVELCHRTARVCFPRDAARQSVALLVGACMPIGLYQCQVVHNEPLAAVFIAASVLVCLQMLSGRRLALGRWSAAVLGGLLGLAILSKATAMLLGPFLVFAIVAQAMAEKVGWQIVVRRFAEMAAAAGLVAGRYHLRNWAALGRPFIGGWDRGRDHAVAAASGPRDWQCLALVLCLVAVPYLQTYDDTLLCLDDTAYLGPGVRGGFTWESLRWAFGYHEANWHPLTWLSHMLDWQLSPWNSGLFKLHNLLLHLGSVGMFFLFLRRSGEPAVAAALAALVFGVHPLRVVSVAWVAERKDCLCVFFRVATMLAYQWYTARRQSAARGGHPRRRLVSAAHLEAGWPVEGFPDSLHKLAQVGLREFRRPEQPRYRAHRGRSARRCVATSVPSRRT